MAQPLYVYLQRPDTGEWVTVGRYLLTKDSSRSTGSFRYAPSYLSAGHAWSIDPINLPLMADTEFAAPRYEGLPDALRDACPDAWGKALIERTHGVPSGAHESRYLLLAGNADRWGALAVGIHKKPSIAVLSAPRLAQLSDLVLELHAIAQRQPPIHAALRKRLLGTPSLGGARPKATVVETLASGKQDFWLVKPALLGDAADIPQLEHACSLWARAAGLFAAPTVYELVGDGGAAQISVLRVLRFDRAGGRRLMTLSAASLLQAEYPAATKEQTARWSYPRLAEELKRIGAPIEDRQELFARMVFNAVIGNDDDHPRNHAVIWQQTHKRWRLSPSFDVVPSLDDTPKQLSMQLCLGRRDISRESVLMDALRFSFVNQMEASDFLNHLLGRIEKGFDEVHGLLDTPIQVLMKARLQSNLTLLRT
jgi:serine/threonine-protein kinase HipA